jgi:hypothetical protein
MPPKNLFTHIKVSKEIERIFEYFYHPASINVESENFEEKLG